MEFMEAMIRGEKRREGSEWRMESVERG